MIKTEILTIPQAAKVIKGLTEHRIRQMCKSGEIQCIMAGTRTYINKRELYKAIGEDVDRLYLHEQQIS